jgi:predicted Zn-dependent peptidase
LVLDIMKWSQIANKRKEIPGYRSEYDPIPSTAREAELPRTPEPAVPDTSAELEKLADLREKGIITDEEFDQKKKQLLGL